MRSDINIIHTQAGVEYDFIDFFAARHRHHRRREGRLQANDG